MLIFKYLFVHLVLLTLTQIKMNTQTQTEDKVLKFIEGPLTKYTIYTIIGGLLTIIFYNGIILNGFSFGSWGL